MSQEEATRLRFRGHSTDELTQDVAVDSTSSQEIEDYDDGDQKTIDAIEKFRITFTKRINNEIDVITNDLVREIEEKKDGVDSTGINTRQYEKVFIPRQSVLTKLLEVSHFQTIYNIFVALLIVIILNTVCLDLLEKGRIDIEFEILTGSFNKLSTTISIWLAMLSTTLLVYPVFHHWAKHTNSFSFDIVWLLLYVAYLIAFLVIPAMYVTKHKLALASSMIVVTEQTRLMMKVHSFVRENARSILNCRKSSTIRDKSVCSEAKKVDLKHVETTSQPFPGFSSYLYFLFCPSLIYRNEYPRTANICWSYVVTNFLQVIGCTMYIYYLYVRFCLPVFRTAGRELANVKTYLKTIFSCVLPATLMFLLAFFAILHSWLNAFAEMLRFADRMFYEDWWNCKSFGNYYRTWNVVVHDWLYAYIYKDVVLLMYGDRRNRSTLAMLMVFFVSALFHEYIISVCLGFFYPILFVIFGGFGVLFIPLTQRKSTRGWNIFIWLMLFFGCGLLLCLYCLEWYARSLCPPNPSAYWSYLLLPRSWTCTAWQE